MSYKVAEIEDQKIWDNFIRSTQPHSFLQFWNWGMCYQENDSKIFRLALYADSKIVGVAQFVKVIAKRGTYLLCPHGPVFSDQKNISLLLPELIKYATNLGRAEGCDFLRVCSALEDTADNLIAFERLGFRPSPMHTHPELAWILDVTKKEDELLMGMRKTTRQMIKRANNEGVEIEFSSDIKDLEKFWPIYQETAKRQHFVPFNKKFLSSELEIFSKDDQLKLLFGKYNGEIVVAAMIVFTENSGFYHHSGSLKKHEKIGISYFLQWEAIRETKKRGLTFYNFWGVSPENRPNHPWAGLSLFKKGFGGFPEPYLHSQDKPLTKKYYLTFLIETLRAFKRGYR